MKLSYCASSIHGALRFVVLGAVLLAGSVGAQAPSLAEAREALAQPMAAARLAGVERLAEQGSMEDVERLVARLRDEAPLVREAATAALWRIWSRSGDAEVDALLMRGAEQMQGWDFDAALATFTEVIGRRPDFAEGWNKRATVLFLMGEHEASLKDCDEVLKRNPNHFGALSGAGQNHVQLGHVEQAIAAYERALAVNPNLPGPAASVEVLKEHLRQRRGKEA
jgi:tetratricopeptide (TPR) repeat protein